MKKTVAFRFALAMFLGCALASCTREEPKPVAPQPATRSQPAGVPAAPAAKSYYCPMHADVVSDKPGACPTCGMPLAERK
ncbi:MAG: hypothetical protein HZA54_13355 [Planctomycetes bacterium]|nr:hypothetical protein [Planctomycetota bacterium]